MAERHPSTGVVRLFVYGTLRSGGRAAALLDRCTLLGTARAAGSLYDVNGLYPALVPGGIGEVEGEVWLCPEERLRSLDEYEGIAEGLFARTRIRIDGEDCWAYVAGPRLAPRLRPEMVVPNGRWPVAR